MVNQTKAQSFSRNAFALSKDASDSRLNHEAAARKYAEAASSTGDSEALRVLKLLQNQHQELSRIVKSAIDHPKAIQETEKDEQAGARSVESPEKAPDSTSPGGVPRSRPSTQRRPPRELRSSIASNLATARGIPSAPQRADHRSSSPSTPSPAKASLERNISHRSSAKQDQSPKEKRTDDARESQRDAEASASPTGVMEDFKPHAENQDAAFQRFYNSFEGLFSKLSAPLAFAGLPLGQIQQPQPSEKLLPDTQQPATSSESPDLQKIYSKAALKAIKDGNERNAEFNDSFYVVPNTGGTVSYARMLSKEERRAREEVNTGGQDDQQDTRNELKGTQTLVDRTSVRSKKTNKTVEELEIENASLKKLTDNLSRRLYMWEKNSQNQTSALQQSMRLMNQHPQEAPANNQGSEADPKHVKELEAQVQSLRKEVDKQAKDNEKLKATITKYRDRWEQLKAGARTRRDVSVPTKLQED